MSADVERPSKVEWGPCCFCGLPIQANGTEPCHLQVSPTSRKWQMWFCHASCFKERLAKSAELMGLFDPAHF